MTNPTLSRFVLAARNGELLALEQALARDPSLARQSGGPDGLTPLMEAILNEQTECARALLPYSDLKATGGAFSRTSLMMSACSHDAGLAQLLLSGSDPLARDIRGFTALLIAAQVCSEDVVDLLTPISDPLVQTSREGMSALMFAAQTGSLRAVRTLLPVSDPNATNARGRTALELALQCGHFDCALALIPQSDLLHQNPEAEMALSWAVKAQDEACVRALLQHPEAHALASQPDAANGRTPLHVAARNDNVSILRSVLRLSDPAATDLHGTTPLMVSVLSGKPLNTQELLPVSDVNAQNDDGETALMLAALCTFQPGVSLLLAVSDLSLVNARGQDAAALMLTTRFWPILDLFAAALPLERITALLRTAGPGHLPAMESRLERHQLEGVLSSRLNPSESVQPASSSESTTGPASSAALRIRRL